MNLVVAVKEKKNNGYWETRKFFDDMIIPMAKSLRDYTKEGKSVFQWLMDYDEKFLKLLSSKEERYQDGLVFVVVNALSVSGYVDINVDLLARQCNRFVFLTGIAYLCKIGFIELIRDETKGFDLFGNIFVKLPEKMQKDFLEANPEVLSFDGEVNLSTIVFPNSIVD